MGNMLPFNVRGAGGGGSSQPKAPYEAPDSLRSTAYAKIIDLVGEGEIYGFTDQVHPLRCVYYQETPVENADGSYNFRNFHITSRVGTQTQDPIPGFDGVENEIAVGVELRSDTPYTVSLENTNVTSVRVRLSTPALRRVEPASGNQYGYNVGYIIQVATDGGPFVEMLHGGFFGKTTTKYERTHKIDLPPAVDGWVLKVIRTTANSEDSNIEDTTFVESYAEIIDVKFRMPMSAVVAHIIDSEQFNSIPSRAYDLKGRIIRVPSNYDADTRVYTGVWDGTFQYAWSDNPAWCFYDMATNPRYGLGRYIPESLVNKWFLYKIAQYCDELVPDGFGGMEPRFTCNLFLQVQNDAPRVMQDMASVFRGMMYAANGAIAAVGDMPDDPIYVYAPANVTDGKFVYAGSARKARHTVALVSWNDMTDMGRAKIEYVEDEDGIARYGINATEVVAVGCTSRGQARRMGKYILTTERYETDTVTFGVGLDGNIPAPGKIIKIADPLRAGRRTGGRIRSSTVSSVVVDQLPEVTVGDDLTTVLADGSGTEVHAVTAVVGNEISIAPAVFTQQPVAQSVWLIESDTLKAQTFRVLGLAESNDKEKFGFMVTALQHVPGKFAYVEYGIQIEEAPISDGVNLIVFPVTGVDMTHHDVADQNTTTKVATITWIKSANAQSYEVLWRQNNKNWVSVGETTSTLIDLVGVMPGTFDVQIIAISASRKRSQPTYAGPYDITANEKPPGYYQDLVDDIAAALLTAENAQAAVDGEIVAFRQPEPPTIGTGFAQNGDIWFDEDDGDAIYRVVDGAWVARPGDALAIAFLQALNAQATADGKAKLFVGPTAPTEGFQLNDMWFNTTLNALFRWNGADWTERVSDKTLDQLAGAGVNVLWDEYAHFDEAQALTTTTTPAFFDGGAALAMDTVADANAYGGFALRFITASNLSSNDWAYFGASTTAYNIPVEPTKKYLLSFRARASVANHKVTFRLKLNDGTLVEPDGSFAAGTKTLGTAYTKYTVGFQLPVGVIRSAVLIAYNNAGSLAAGVSVYYDQLMLEPAVGTLNVGSAWVQGSTVNKVLQAQISADNAQNAADAAAADAAASLNQLADIASDSKLTANEKILARTQYNEVTGEQAGIDAQATTYAITASIKTDYDNAVAALKTYLFGLGLVSASPTYAWTNITGTTTIDGTVWNTKWNDVYLNRQTVLNAVAQKVGSQLQNGFLVPPSFGDEIVINGSFESVGNGGPAAATHAIGTVLCDGWEISEQAGNGVVAKTGVETGGMYRTGNKALFLGLMNTTTVAIPNNASHYALASMKQSLSVTPGEQFLVTLSATENFSNAIPAGLTHNIFVGIRFWDATGAFIGVDNAPSGLWMANAAQNTLGGAFNESTNRKTVVVTAPAGAVTARVVAYNYLANTSGASINLPANSSHVRVDDLSIKRIVSQGTAANMLDNSEFIRGATAWGNVVATDVVKVQDSYRPQKTLAAGASVFPYQDVAYSIFVGKPYSASVEVGWGGTVDASAYAQLQVQFFDAGYANLLATFSTQQYKPGAGATGGATLLAINGAVAPAGTAIVRYVLTFVGQAVWYYRKPKLERNIVATAYTPGADSGYGTELTYGGSGRQIGDLRNLNPASPANVASAWISGSLTYTAAAGSPATATISFSAGTLRIGGVDIAYNAATVGITGVNGTTVTYLVYFDDATYAGGTRTLGATTTYSTLINSGSRVYIGSINVTFPTSGSGGGGGDVKCVAEWAFVPEGDSVRKMGAVNAGEVIHAINPVTRQEYMAPVFNASSHMAECLMLVTENGVKLPCSLYAPICSDRGLVPAHAMMGREMLTRVDGVQGYSLVTDIVRIGMQPVRHITAEVQGKHEESGSFWAGSEPGKYGAHHNLKAT